MASKLFPANPSDVLVIRDLTPNITTLSLPFSRAGLVKFGGRATLVRLSATGSLAVFSPVALTPEVRAKIASLASPELPDDAKVTHIIAPDLEHHIYLSDWKAAFPGAKLIGPAGLPEKRAKQGKTDEFAVVFPSSSSSSSSSGVKPKREVTVDPVFDADFSYELVDAHPNKELVFCHKPDRVLIEADLLFNLPPTEQYSRLPEAERKPGFLDGIVWAMLGTDGDPKWSRRAQWYLFSAGDRDGFNESLGVIDSWDFDTLVPCHGETLVGNGKERFRNLFRWHLDAAGGHKKQD